MWFRQQTASGPNFWLNSWLGLWPDLAALSRRLAADEAELRRRFWRRLKREAASLPFAEQALTAHYCAFDRQTPLYVKAVLVGALVYFVVPDRLLAKNLPLMIFLDDAAVLAAAVKAVSAHIRPEHRQAAQHTLARLRA